MCSVNIRKKRKNTTKTGTGHTKCADNVYILLDRVQNKHFQHETCWFVGGNGRG